MVALAMWHFTSSPNEVMCVLETQARTEYPFWCYLLAISDLIFINATLMTLKLKR